MLGTDFNSKLEGAGFYIIVIFLLFYSFFPALWLLLTSLKKTSQIIHVPIEFFPDPVVFSQYKEVFSKAPFDQFILNSVIVSLGSTLLCIFIATLASYALARLNVPGKNVFLVSFLLISTFPLIALMVPLFKIFRELSLLNTYWALILPYTVFSLPISIWILTTFFREIPDDLEEAARIDGCSRVSALVRVIFPLSAPGVATAAMISFVNSWNEFTLAFSLMSDKSMYTLPVGITYLKDQYTVPWGLISSGIIIAIVPLIILIIFFQKRLISGLTAGAIKG
ncbi:carbohydrate ABC transporter permease [Candidatus Bipolaricaulota bacterium]|nr:carbohydrate ABC transporter permease [Candidatus Bipolaricaulota bacterium]